MELYEYTIRTCNKKDIIKTIKAMSNDFWEFICSCPIDISDRELYFKRLKTTQYPTNTKKASDIMYFTNNRYNVSTTMN